MNALLGYPPLATAVPKLRPGDLVRVARAAATREETCDYLSANPNVT
jgi:hypothetical protein